MVSGPRGCKSKKALGNSAQTSSLRSFGVAPGKCIFMLIAGRKTKLAIPCRSVRGGSWYEGGDTAV